jgi:hypothetical protein
MEKYQIKIHVKAIFVSLNHKNTQTDILEKSEPKKAEDFLFLSLFSFYL